MESEYRGKHVLEPWMCPENNFDFHEWVKVGDLPQSAEVFRCKYCNERMVD